MTQSEADVFRLKPQITVLIIACAAGLGVYAVANLILMALRVKNAD